MRACVRVFVIDLLLHLLFVRIFCILDTVPAIPTKGGLWPGGRPSSLASSSQAKAAAKVQQYEEFGMRTGGTGATSAAATSAQKRFILTSPLTVSSVEEAAAGAGRATAVGDGTGGEAEVSQRLLGPDCTSNSTRDGTVLLRPASDAGQGWQTETQGAVGTGPGASAVAGRIDFEHVLFRYPMREDVEVGVTAEDALILGQPSFSFHE